MIPKTTFHAVRREGGGGGGGEPMTQSCGGKSERQEVPGKDSLIGETYRKKSVSIGGETKSRLSRFRLVGTAGYLR